MVKRMNFILLKQLEIEVTHPQFATIHAIKAQ